MNFHIDIFLYFLKFFGVQLLNNVVLVSAEQQSISVIHLHIATLFFRFYSHMGHYRVLSRVPLLYNRSY